MKDKIYLQRLRENVLNKNNFLTLSGEGVRWDTHTEVREEPIWGGGAVTSRRWYRISHCPARYQKQLRSDIINILLRNPERLSVEGWVHEIRKTLHLVITNARNYKGKAVPLQAWSGSEGSRKLRFPDFMTTAQDGGNVVRLTHRPPLPPGNTPGTHFC